MKISTFRPAANQAVDAAFAALEAVEGRDTSVEAILARHGEERLSPEKFDRHFGSLPTSGSV